LAGRSRKSFGKKTKRAAIAAARHHFQFLSDPTQIEIYFLSSVGAEFDGVDGVLGVVGGVVPSPCIPSLKLRTPAPNPRITSGIFFPPKNKSTTAKTISQ
jgi:hypothetical protein